MQDPVSVPLWLLSKWPGAELFVLSPLIVECSQLWILTDIRSRPER